MNLNFPIIISYFKSTVVGFVYNVLLLFKKCTFPFIIINIIWSPKILKLSIPFYLSGKFVKV